jgi:hypothetical protein
MRLTNQMRDDFVNAVMSKVRRRQRWSREVCVEEINKRFAAVLADDIKEFMEKHPNLVPRESKCLPDWLCWKPDGERHRRYSYASVVLGQKIEDINIDDIQKNHELWKKEEERRNQMTSRLRDVAYSVTTNTDLAAALPDLIKFVPKDEPKPKKLLPVANSQLFKDLKSLGLEVEK